MALTQFKIGNTYYGFDPDSKALVALPDEATLKQYFPQGIDPKAKPLPLDPKDGLLLAANQNPGKAIDVNTLQVAANQPATTQPFDPAQYGISPELWATLSPADQAFAESTAGILKSQFDQGQTNVSINQDLLNKALIAAQNDPNIIAKYGDSAKTAASDIAFNLGQINSNYATAQTLQNLTLEKQKKDLADQESAAGRAYSGFRGQAEQMLNANQSNIIQSSKSQLQQQLQTLGRGYESQYGSTALSSLPPLKVGDESYTQIGGITGSVPIAKQAEIESRQQQIYQNEKQ